MTTRQVQRTKPHFHRLIQQPRWATLWLLGVTTCFVVISFAWSANIGGISQIFHTLNDWQQASRGMAASSLRKCGLATFPIIAGGGAGDSANLSQTQSLVKVSADYYPTCAGCQVSTVAIAGYAQPVQSLQWGV
ncbi:hypothetical protein [Leptothermofonsia sp. ETS-13]|uniref:hypothetical protein n=1 Tax=Leptothermofonsia sp. ETS-13 TaxID=3035696 RepID=UPI003BA29F2A